MIKTFIGIKIEPTEDLILRFESIKNRFKKSKIEWVNKNNFHITLKYLGETNPKQIQQINDFLLKISKKNKKTIISIADFGVFPKISNPKVFWFGVKNYKDLEKLKIEIDKNINPLGFLSEQKYFKPHLTLGRSKEIEEKKNIINLFNELKNIELQTVKVNTFILYQSLIENNTRIYKPIFEYKLN